MGGEAISYVEESDSTLDIRSSLFDIGYSNGVIDMVEKILEEGEN